MSLILLPVRSRDLKRREEGGRSGEKSKRGRLKKNSDTSRGHSYRSFTVRDVGCKGHEKTWTEVCGSSPQEWKRGLGISQILSR